VLAYSNCRTGFKVSRLALGCMSYGDPTTANAHEWSLREEEAQPYFQQAVELGITFWDAANVYQAGTSEEVVGRAITRYSRRQDIVLSRKAILEQIGLSHIAAPTYLTRQPALRGPFARTVYKTATKRPRRWAMNYPFADSSRKYFS
jgi:diketogulonate reductase-like aldo/keto reductase